VLLWGKENDPSYREVLSGLQRVGLSVHRIGDVLPLYEQDRSVYELSPYDEHPHAMAHDLIADYVVSNILGR
jgi:hypothetical protein